MSAGGETLFCKRLGGDTKGHGYRREARTKTDPDVVGSVLVLAIAPADMYPKDLTDIQPFVQGIRN